MSENNAVKLPGVAKVLIPISLVTPVLLYVFLKLPSTTAVNFSFWSKTISGVILAIVFCCVISFFTLKEYTKDLAKLRKHPFVTSVILFGAGLCLLDSLYLTVYPLGKIFSIYITTPLDQMPKTIYILSPLEFVKRISFTATISVLLAPYFYVLWVWRHNNTERQAARENIQDNLNHFNSLVSQFSSGSEAIQIATAQGMEKFLDNLSDSEPNIDFFYEQAIAIFAEPSLYKDKKYNDMHDKNYYLKVTRVLESLQCMYHEVTCRNNHPKYAVSRTHSHLFPSQLHKLTNGVLVAFGKFRSDIKVFEYCLFEVNYNANFISEQESANAQGLCKITCSEGFIVSLEKVEEFIDCSVDLSVAKEIDLDNPETRAALEAFIQKVNSFEGLNCPMPEELTNTTEVNSV